MNSTFFNLYDLNGTAGMTFSPDFTPNPASCGFTSPDPRTIDVIRNERIAYDRPPLKTPNTQPLENMYSTPGLEPKFYDSYKDINGGQIIYYTDPEIANPYGTDTYCIPSIVVPTILQDPMGAERPYYEKIPIFQNNKFVSEYSFDQDQIGWREDLIAKQQEKNNSQLWDSYQYYANRSEYFNLKK